MPCLNGFAQSMSETAEIIKKINAVYQGMNTFQYEVAYKLYKDHSSEQIIEYDSATITRSEKATHFKMRNIETFSDGKYDVMVNHEDRVIIVSKYSAMMANPLSHLSLDSILSICNYIQSANYGDVNCIYMGFAGSEANGISVCYNKNTFNLFALVIYYRDERRLDESDINSVLIKPRLEMRYLRSTTNPDTDIRKMKSSWYFRCNNNKLTPTDRFKSYQLINQIIEQ